MIQLHGHIFMSIYSNLSQNTERRKVQTSFCEINALLKLLDRISKVWTNKLIFQMGALSFLPFHGFSE